MIKPIVTEKTVKVIETENTLNFEIPRRMTKTEFKRIFEKMFNVKTASIRTRMIHNKKYLSVVLEKNFKAIDLATKLGMI